MYQALLHKGVQFTDTLLCCVPGAAPRCPRGTGAQRPHLSGRHNPGPRGDEGWRGHSELLCLADHTR